MKRIFIGLLIFLFLGNISKAEEQTKIVLLAGAKSHGPGHHEYIKTVRLLKTMLDNAGIEGLETEIYLNGWPDHPSALEEADLIFITSDGQDGDKFSPVPFMTDERMKIIEKQIDRGCGLFTYHFSTFAPDKYGPQILNWVGAYFDWQDETGARNWYSAIETLESDLKLYNKKHPVLNGVEPFRLKDEFYYNLRFAEKDQEVTPLLGVPELKSKRKKGEVVAWAVERENGYRGFGTSTGHFFSNWTDENYRKMMLNAILWTAGREIPEDGITSPFYSRDQVSRHLFGTETLGLILTGHHHPGHIWEETSGAIEKIFNQSGNIHVDISTEIEDLKEYELDDYDFLVLNYVNWKQPTGLSEKSKQAFTNYIKNGGGLILIHFSNGAWHSSLPEAAESDWPEYRNLCLRVWDHNNGSAHDKYGDFEVNVTEINHPITKGVEDFGTTDELYYNQVGDEPITPLLTALSKDTGKNEPLAWVHQYGEGKIFQTLLGHGVSSFIAPEFQEVLVNAAHWVSGESK